MKFGFNRSRGLARAAATLVADDNADTSVSEAAAAAALAEANRQREQNSNEGLAPKATVESPAAAAEAAGTAAAPNPEPAPEPAAAAVEPDADAKAAERVAAVFASEHSKGRERQAAKLLANPKLSADEITELLADLKPDTAAADPMRGALASQPNPDIRTGNEPRSGQKAADEIWDRARAANASL